MLRLFRKIKLRFWRRILKISIALSGFAFRRTVKNATVIAYRYNLNPLDLMKNEGVE